MTFRFSISSILPGLLLPALLAAGAARAEPSLFHPSPLTQSLATPSLPVTPSSPAQSPAATPTRKPAATVPAQAQEARGLIESAGVAATQRLRHLPNNTQGYRLAGEIGSSEWPVFFTQAQASQRIRFQLGYLSAVSVMPEASRLIVQINDVVIAETPVRAPHAVKVATFDVPPDLVKPGFNSLRILVQQRHRVDCSLKATYELWTQIDPSQTGFILAADDPGVTAIEDIAALAPNPQGALPVRAILPSASRAARIERTLRAIQIVAINGRFEQPLVEVEAGAARDLYGLNVAVGVHEELRLLPGLERLRRPDGPFLRMLPARGARPTLVVSGNDEREVDEALVMLGNALELTGSEQGARAARIFPGLRMRGGEEAMLRDFGISTQEFSGRLYRTSFQVILPSDFYPADYAKSQLVLDGGYSAGLSTDAQIVVNVNGRNVVGVPLPRSHGEIFRAQVIELPLGAMRPGLNRIEIEAHLPTAGDKGCDSAQMLAQKQRFLLRDSTRLKLPAIARIARMPDLSVTATGAFPYKSYPSNLFVPKPDRETIAAAATLAARLAVSGGGAMDLRFTTTAPKPGEGATIVIGAAATLDDRTFADAGLARGPVDDAWRDWSEEKASRGLDERLSRFEAIARANYALQRNFPPACRMRAASPRVREALRAARETGARDRAAVSSHWAEVEAQSGYLWSAVSHALFMGRSASLWLAGHFRPEGPVADVGEVVTAAASLVIAQESHGKSGDGIWTLVTAPTPMALMESIACIVDPRVWMQMGGRVAALDSSEARIASLASTRSDFVATQALSVGNARLIVAGWFSLNRWSYVVLTLLAAIALGASTFWLVRNVGRRDG